MEQQNVGREPVRPPGVVGRGPDRVNERGIGRKGFHPATVSRTVARCASPPAGLYAAGLPTGAARFVAGRFRAGNDSLSLTVVNCMDFSRAEARPEAPFH